MIVSNSASSKPPEEITVSPAGPVPATLSMSEQLALTEPDFQGTPDPREPDYVFWACVSVLAVLVLHLFCVISHL